MKGRKEETWDVMEGGEKEGRKEGKNKGKEILFSFTEKKNVPVFYKYTAI